MKKIIYLLPAALMAGCLQYGDPYVWTARNVAVIVNEGSPNNSNGTINFYSEADSSIKLNPIRNDLNDLIQANIRSATFTNGGNLWVVCNNPNKIVGVDVITGNDVIIIDSLSTPVRALFQSIYLFVANRGAPNSNGGYNSYVQMYSLAYQLRPVQKFAVASNPQDMLVCQNKLYVAGDSGVQVFDLSRMNDFDIIMGAPIAAIPPASEEWGGARRMVLGAANDVWVSYTGGVLQCINGVTEKIHRIGIPIDSASGSIAIERDGTSIVSYVTQSDGAGSPHSIIYRTSLATGDTTAIFSGAYNLSGIGVNPSTGSIYTADTRADGRSDLIVIKNGSAKHIPAGVNTRQFLFFEILESTRQ